MTERRSVIFIDTPASTLAASTEGNTNGAAVSTHEYSSPEENSDDICIPHNEMINSLSKILSKLTSRNMDHATSTCADQPAAEGADSDQTPRDDPNRSIADIQQTRKRNTQGHMPKWCPNSGVKQRTKPSSAARTA